MIDLLLILHFSGLMLAAAGVAGGLFSLGGGAQTTRGRGRSGKSGSRQGRVYSGVAALGLVLLVPTGIVLLTSQTGVPQLGAMFWMKMVFVALLVSAVATIEMVHNGGLKRSGNLLVSLGPLAGMSLLACVVFSVLAFH